MSGERQYGVSGADDTAVAAALQPPPASRRRPSVVAVLGAVFGPRPVESALWGVGLGAMFGLPLVLGYFVAHYSVMEVALAFGGDQLAEGVTDDDGTAILLGAGFGAMAFAFLGMAGLGLLIAKLRRTNLATILLVAYAASFVPYTVFFLAFVSS